MTTRRALSLFWFALLTLASSPIWAQEAPVPPPPAPSPSILEGVLGTADSVGTPAAIAVLIWMAWYGIKHLLPKLVASFAEALAKQQASNADVVKQQRDDFTAALKQQRDDFGEALARNEERTAQRQKEMTAVLEAQRRSLGELTTAILTQRDLNSSPPRGTTAVRALDRPKLLAEDG